MQFKTLVAFAMMLLTASVTEAQGIEWHSPEAVARAAVEGNPAVASPQAQIVAARERASAAGAYPNPMLMGGIQSLQVNLANDEMMTMYMVGASQTVPRRQRRDALKRSAELVVEQLESDAASLREEVRRDALLAWYDLATADSRRAATNELRAAVEAMIVAARIRYEVGTTIQADVIRAQLQLSEIDHQLLSLDGQREAAEVRLLTLLGLPLTSEIPALALAHGTERRTIASVPAVPEDHPALKRIAAEVRLQEQEIRLARLLTKPDWSIEASYGLRTAETDMFSVVARMELPLRKTRVIEPQVRAAIAEREAATNRTEATRRQIAESLGVAYAVHAEATRQLQFHEQVLVPQSKMAFDSTLAAYQSGRDNFESVLSALSAYLRLQIDYYEFLARHIKAVADFEALQRGARFGSIGRGGMPMREQPMARSASMTGGMR